MRFLRISPRVPLLPPPSRAVWRPNSLPLPFQTPATQATASRTLQAKGEMCTLLLDKLCYNAININYVLVLVYVQKCRRAQFLVCHGPS